MKQMHTPGPWKMYPSATASLSVGPKDGPVAYLYGAPGKIATWTQELQVLHANARLICAAPEMLAALQDILPALTGHGEWREAMTDQLSHSEQPYHNLAAAIAAALGTEQANKKAVAEGREIDAENY